MKEIIKRLIVVLKTSINDNVSLIYLFRFFASKFIYLLWGMIRFFTFKMIFLTPSSTIKSSSKIRIKGTLVIAQDCYVDALSRDGIEFGNRVALGRHTSIECSSSISNLGKGLIVGDYTSLGSHGFYGCAGGIKIGSNVLIGNYVSMHSENHVFIDPDVTIREQGVTHQGITIGNDCWIGARVTILDGANIGEGCVIAAGAVVRGIIPPYSVIAGIPAKIIKRREKNYG